MPGMLNTERGPRMNTKTEVTKLYGFLTKADIGLLETILDEYSIGDYRTKRLTKKELTMTTNYSEMEIESIITFYKIYIKLK